MMMIDAGSMCGKRPQGEETSHGSISESIVTAP